MLSDITFGKTLDEIICKLSEAELMAFAEAEALEEQNSSRIEHIDLDAETLKEKLLTLYRGWRAEAAAKNTAP